MKNIKRYTLAVYVLIAIVFILGFQFQVSKAEGVDYVADTMEKREILWLARIIYSETKKESEQVLVAWIVRNRVDTEFRGSTYEQVAKSPAQFSGLHSGDAQYSHNISREYESAGESWKKALSIAKAVYFADESLRPFPETVRHFYSPRSVLVDPDWAATHKPVVVLKDNENEQVRFAFYDSVK